MLASSGRRYAAEFLGTLALLVFGGGAAVFTLGGIGTSRTILVSLAFGLTVAALIWVLGEYSGGHFNPAVTISMAIAKKMPARDVLPYLVAQVVGAILGVLLIWGIVLGSSPALDAAKVSAFASQCYAGNGSPCGFAAGSVFLLELVLTFFFVLVIHRLTRPGISNGLLTPLGIGLTLAMGNLVGIPVDGASLNPARSFAPALISAQWSSAQWAIQQDWLFWVAPIIGGAIAAVADRWMSSGTPAPAIPPPPP